MRLRDWRWLALVAMLVGALVVAGCGDDDDDEAGGDEDFTFGMILVGPQDDRGWSQAHFEAGTYVEEQTGGTMIAVDKVNPADKPETTVEQVVDDMIAQGAQLVFATSDDMKDGIQLAAEKHPDVPMIWASGDSAWEEGKAFREDLPNLGNIMGKMEYGKMIAGCAAALQSANGQISYLGPLINDETRRLTNSAYLGARHCWTEVRDQDAADLSFDVKWIGFWFNIPGVTLDPTQVVNEFFDSGSDVVISGIDTTEAIVRAGQRSTDDAPVWAVPYDFEGACAEAEEVCLGVPYFNWRPAYLETAQSVIDGEYEGGFQWNAPDWDNLDDITKTAIGWVDGQGLTAENAEQVDAFIDGLADGSIDLFTGPLNYQDGSAFLAEGETATDQQIWYTPQLLEGTTGASTAE
jgi:simple sugar transport system substrate-binding protein